MNYWNPPRVKDSEVASSWRQELYGRYRRTLEVWGQSMPMAGIIWQYRRRWSRFLPSARNNPVLDIGCGSGDFLLFLGEMGFTELHGVDRSQEQVSAARARGLQHVEVTNGIDYLRQFDGYFGVISAQNVLEHLTRDELLTMLHAAHRALKPQGELWVVVPNALSPFGMAVRYGDLTHENCFTPQSIIQALTICGFSDVRFAELAPIPHGVKSLARAVIWQAIRLALHVWRLVEFGEAQPAVYTHDMQVLARKL